MKRRSTNHTIIAVILIILTVSLATVIFAHKKPRSLGLKQGQSSKTVSKTAEKVVRKNSRSTASWSGGNVRQAVHTLSRRIGVRTAGSRNEHRAANYIEKRLKDIGYKPKRQRFRVPGRKRSYNIIAGKIGRDPKKRIILGAHYDSKSPAPGANDNGSGVATLLELAKLFKSQNPRHSVIFVFFGAEERVGKNPNSHHFGSRYYVRRMSKSAKKRTFGMVSVDMVGYGRVFNVRSMKKGSMRQVNSLMRFAKRIKLRMKYLKDPGRTGWSDHEPFELNGVPAAWIEWRNDPRYHSKKDNFSHMQWRRITTAGRFLYKYLR